MRLRLPKILRIGGLAFRHSLWLILTSGIILLLPFMVSYFFLTTSVSELFEEEAGRFYYRARVRMGHLKDMELKLLQHVTLRGLTCDSLDEIRAVMKDLTREDTLLSVYGFSLIPYPLNDHLPYMHFRVKDSLIGHGHAVGQSLHDDTNSLFQNVRLTGLPQWSEPYKAPDDSTAFLADYLVPCYKLVGAQRVFTGVVKVEVSAATMQNLVNKYRGFFSNSSQFGDKTYAIMVSDSGRIFISTRSSLLNQLARDVEDTVIKNDISYCSSLADQKGALFEHELPRAGFEEKSRSAHLVKFRDPGWTLIVVFGSHRLVNVIEIVFLVFYGIFIVILLIAYIVRIRKIAMPIQRLADASRQLGKGDFDVKFPKRRKRDEIAQLTESMVYMRDELKTYITNLKETTEAKEKIESELKVAQMIQMGMLPREFTLPENWDLFATLDPARAVGGDLYDFFYLDDEHLCIAIGDVAGKGVPGSLFMMVARTLLRSTAKQGLPVNEMIAYINQELCRENPSEMFVTFFAGIINLKTGEMEFCNAGHNYPYIVRPGGQLQQLRVRNGIPMGIFPDTMYTREYYTFNPQEVLILVTDGITEAQNVTDDFFGEDNLASTLIRLAGRPTREITELLIVELKRFAEGAEQSDDITILSLRYRGGKE